jgi:hypothetical protein
MQLSAAMILNQGCINMNEHDGTILATLLLFMIVISLFAVSAVNITNDSANITNSTDSTNQTIDASVDAPVRPMSVWVSLTVTPTSVNLGSVDADGVERTFTGVTTARIRALGFSGNLFVRASDNFINSANSSQIIPLNNFQFDCPGYVTKRPFTTTNQLIHEYNYFLIYDVNYTMNYYLTVPRYTDPGVYSTTVIYTAT